MRFQTPLVPARLIRRYKRFLADARLEDGREIIAHCANPGSMMGLADEGMKIWLELNDDPRFKTHNQNMTVAARAIADRNTLGHRS
jgi:sugar fermentation stimulation protein A